MKLKILTILLVLIGVESFGQCSAIYHYRAYVTDESDTINRTNSEGYYYGKHIYGDNDDRLINDSTSYIIGNYEKGKPIGLWINHCKNGTYSIGSYNSGIQVTTDKNGGWTEKEQGIYAKIGEWKFFNSDSTLIKTETYERLHNKKGWTNKTYLKVKNENVLIQYNFNSRHNLKSRFKVQTNIVYGTNKSIKTKSESNFFKHLTISYYPNGKIKSSFKCKKILGKKINKSVSKEFNENGEIVKKEKGKCWTTIGCY